MKTTLFVCLCFLISVSPTFAQTPPPPDSTLAGALSLFVDCSSCDLNFFKEEIKFANFVRDRHLADVHILVDQQTTGSNGASYTLEFIGQGRFDGMRDTLTYVVPPDETADALRQGLVKTIKLGLVRFAAKTPQVKDLSVSFANRSVQEETHDRWNYWVFNAKTQGYFNGQKGYHYLSLYNDISANRVTEQLKIKTDFWTNYNEQKFTDDMYLSRSYGAYAAIAPSLTEHWSAGIQGELYSSSYSNVDAGVTAGPLIEYDIFPYKDANRNMLTFSYSVAARYYDYVETTIYGKDNEWRIKEGLEAYIETTQPWGTLSTSVTFSNYLHDFSMNRLSISSNISLNLVAGLQLTGDLYYSRVYDQIGLPAGGVTDNESLLRLREQATNYSYSGSFGFQYTFGSKYNNVVNRRFNW